MITVAELWRLKPGLEERAVALMQEMDDLVGPNAHLHPGWCGHATFLQNTARPQEIVMQYAWRSIEQHADLAAQEEAMLGDFYARYCSAPREIQCYEELPVEVDHDDDHHHHHHGSPA